MTRTMAVFAAFLLLGAAGAAAQNDICMTSVGGLAGNPTIDGIVDGFAGIDNDPGWNGATRWNLSADAGSTTAVKFQSGARSGFLYMAYVIDTPSIGLDDTIAMMFSTDATPAHDWRIFIQPFQNALPPDGSGIVPFAVTWWRDSTVWNTGAGAQTANPGFWLIDNVRLSRSGNRWALEIKIPILTNPADAGLTTGIYFPNPGTFRFWTDVLNAITINAVTQAPFPPGVNVVPLGQDIFLAHNTPAVASWGTASLNDRPACDGVSLAWSDIGVEFPANSGTIVQQIRRNPAAPFGLTEPQCDALQGNINFPAQSGPANIFIARPVNGMGTPAKNVTATFRVADWGIPGTAAFEPLGAPPFNGSYLGVTNNPTPVQTIAPGAQGILKATWALTYKQSCQFAFPDRSHQCMQVDLDSNDPATRFKNKSVQKNMDVVPASRFAQTAKISGNQGELPKGEKAHRFFLLVDTDQQKPLKDNKTSRFRSDELYKLSRPYQKSNLYAWIARGYVATGNKLIIRRNTYEIVRHAGDFGYVAVHNGTFGGWTSNFSGKGMEQIGKTGVYTLAVAPGRSATVETVIEAYGDFIPGSRKPVEKKTQPKQEKHP